MSASTSPPPICRTCRFFGKCFGPQHKAGALPPTTPAGDFFSYRLKVGGIATRVLQSGSIGHPVIFIHGAGGRADRWVYNLGAIAQHGYRSYAPDLPGHGLAEKNGAFNHSIDGYCRFLDDFMETIGADHATLVGTSLGGGIAATLAVRHPERIAGLVLAGSPGVVRIGSDLRERLRRVAAFRSPAGALEQLRRVFLSPLLATGELAEEEFLVNNSLGARGSLEKLGRYLSDRLDEDAVGCNLNDFAREHPVLFVWGREDRILPLSLGHASLALIDGQGALAVVAESAHAVHYEKPGLFNRLVRDHLAGEIGHHDIEGVDIHHRTPNKCVA